jgi:hypothetical protein
MPNDAFSKIIGGGSAPKPKKFVAPVIEPPTEMPDPEATKRAARREAAFRASRGGGRTSTILTNPEKLG